MLLDDINSGYRPRNSIVGESSFWILIKEWFLNKRKIKFAYYAEFHRDEPLSEAMSTVDWARENITGRWHIRVYNEPIVRTTQVLKSLTVVAKFNREEDAFAFKMRWM